MLLKKAGEYWKREEGFVLRFGRTIYKLDLRIGLQTKEIKK